jgi:hypothetical protein
VARARAPISPTEHGQHTMAQTTQRRRCMEQMTKRLFTICHACGCMPVCLCLLCDCNLCHVCVCSVPCMVLCCVSLAVCVCLVLSPVYLSAPLVRVVCGDCSEPGTVALTRSRIRALLPDQRDRMLAGRR